MELPETAIELLPEVKPSDGLVGGLARDDAQALRRDVELLGGDLRKRGQHALADLHLAGRQPHAAALLEADPASRQRIVDEALRQRVGDHGCARHRGAGARCTARMMRLCMPQRQR